MDEIEKELAAVEEKQQFAGGEIALLMVIFRQGVTRRAEAETNVGVKNEKIKLRQKAGT